MEELSILFTQNYQEQCTSKLQPAQYSLSRAHRWHHKVPQEYKATS